MRRLFVVICLLLLYGSLYPWQYQAAGISLWQAILRVLHSWPASITNDILQDVGLNLVVYVPLGLLGYLTGRRGFRWSRAAWPIGVGFSLSFAVETLQSYVPGRVPSALDLCCNTAGSIIGVLTGIVYEFVIVRLSHGSGIHLRRRPSSALMMLILFAAQETMPAMLHALERFNGAAVFGYQESMAGGRWSVFASTLAAWMLAGRFLEVLQTPTPGKPGSLPLRTASGLVLLAAALSVFRINSPLGRVEWAGIAAGILGYTSSASWMHPVARDRFLAVAGLAWLTGAGLRPYQFVANNRFSWIPFEGMMGSDWLRGVASLLNKAWMYGSAFWIWERTGLGRPVCAAALIVVLAGIEYAQMFLPGRVSTMTDLAMGAIAAGLLWSVERKYGV